MMFLLIALFFSGGTVQTMAFAKDTTLATCQAKAAEAKTAFAGKPMGNKLVTGVGARCVLVPRSNDL